MIDHQRSRLKGKKRIAIVHDALVVPAGSERVALTISNIFPDAPVYTSGYLPDNTFPEFKVKEVRTLPFGRGVRSERQFKSLYPLWYLGFSLLDLSAYDLVISSANYLAKYIRPPRATTHLCYLHNPVRFLWKPGSYSEQSVPYGRASLSLVRLLLPILRKMDIERTRKIDHLATNSRNIASQIHDIYHREARIIHPPVDVKAYQISSQPGDYYLYAGRLISHKRADLAIRACNRLKRRLVVAGDGLERGKLEKIAGSTIEFTGRTTDEQMRDLYANCRALIFPSHEDFGMVPVEAQACGRPVIAYKAGGVLESMIEFETGVFFEHQTEESVIEAILRFETLEFDPGLIRQNAMRFDLKEFENQLIAYIESFEP